MNDLIEAEHCNSTPTTAEQSVSLVCELSSESDSARKWDGLQDEWHPNDDGIVPIRQIMALDQRGEANTLAQVLEWRPFRSKEHLIATLVVGYAHQIVSRSFYEHLRVMYRMFDVGLPHWTTIWCAKAKLRRVLNLDVKAATSILNQSLFGLSLKSILAQEIANPVVSPMIEYYPQDAGGRNIYKLTQSKKWLHHLSKANRAQMWDEHLAKCAIPQFVTHEGSDLEMIVAENPAFDDAQLFSIPVTQFYRDYPRIQDGNGQMLAAQCNNSLTDNTASGNQSKKWNKHISYFFTLSGLPPSYTNQNYNCHFLSTSNSAGPMELVQPIVDEYKQMSEDRFIAYDWVLGQEVMIFSNILCFLGDSPMHAEITSTPLPANSLHPCRACKLSTVARKGKPSLAYVQQFFMIANDGSWVKNKPRNWEELKLFCKQVWAKSKTPRSKKHIQDMATALGDLMGAKTAPLSSFMSTSLAL
ncbi:hypothetical protein PCANC_06010 [Puccinia coronata f. sp. avenae]|uniref:Uncharacterized protein n=1 Tax=Puccinia coronata f. sp. avenae TaxID=200324 RepID=A0A2N5VTY3_9BASI|nr:hypothetical protein PCANC_06010 [Puccinia coronata f. sp. avenae]